VISLPEQAPLSSAKRDVVVVGGGVVGAACAYYLRQAGRQVTIVDRGRFGGGCSHGNCGYVCPSHVLPLAAPGALWSTLKTMASRNSPLKVRWRFDPALWGWFRRFAKRCNRRDMLAAGHALQALLRSSRRLYDDLLRETLTDVEWRAQGLLFVFQSAAAMDHYADTDRLLRDEFDLAAVRYDGEALLKLEPSLRPGVAGAWHYRNDGHLRPDKLMSAWRRVLESQGVEIIEDCELLDANVDGGQIRSLQTPRGEIAAEQVVIATGAWTPQWNRLLRCPIPIQPGKGYALTLPLTEHAPRLPMIFEEHRVAITPLAGAYRIGSTMEFAGYDATLNPSRLRLLRDGAARYLRDSISPATFESWWGWRPMTPDGLPYLGRVPKLANVYLAAGHGMLGVSLAPATGRLLAEIITGRTPHVDPAPYAVERKT
jgi:D-amino-acid dehydrogenase